MGTLQMTWQPSLLKSTKRKLGRPPLGLRNLGNSCYLNSVLQCLTYTPPLANFCLRLLHSSSCNLVAKEKKGECPFCMLEKRIARSLSSESNYDAPIKINSCLSIFSEHLRIGRQEDAHEFLRYVIDACHDTCLRLKKLEQQRKSGVSNGWDKTGTEETVVKEIFGGALQSQVKCLPCGTESNKVDDIMDISLDILHTGSLKEAMQKFFQPEILDGNNKYKCDNCKKLVTARKQMSILQAPNILVIQLKRFEGLFGRKVDKPIAFDEILLLSSYMCKTSQDPNPEYKLFGTIVHSGLSADSGHYYAYIKDASGRWYCCNDSYVSPTTLQEVLSEKVYILFFSRTKQRLRSFGVDLIANGSGAQESNGSKASLNLKSGSLGTPLSTKQLSKCQLETNNSAKSNGNTGSLIRHSGCLGKSGSIEQVSDCGPVTKNSVRSIESVGSNGSLNQKSEGVVKPESMKRATYCPSETTNSTEYLGSNGIHSSIFQTSDNLIKPLGPKQTSDPSSQTNGSTITMVDQRHSSPQRKHDNSGKEKLPATRNIKFIVYARDNGAAPVTSTEKDQTKGSFTDTNGVGKSTSSDLVHVEKIGPLSMENGTVENGNLLVDSSFDDSCYINGTTTIVELGSRVESKLMQNGSSTLNSGMKRKTQENGVSILLARDVQSRAKVEEFKEIIGKEASLLLQSCGWSNDVCDFMRARKKFCASELEKNELNVHDKKRLLISPAEQMFRPKVPESVKASLVERLMLFSSEYELPRT